MAARRVVSLSLPPSDPASATIAAWLDAQPAGSDTSATIRRLLAGAIGGADRLAAIEDKLDRLLAGQGAAPALAPDPAADEETLSRLFDFGV